MNPLKSAIVTAFDSNMSTFNVYIDIWQDDATYLGQITVSLNKTNVQDGQDWRSLYQAPATTYLATLGYSAPQFYWIAADGDQADWNQTNTTAPDFIKNKPTIGSTTRTTSTLSGSLVGTGATGTQISSTKDSTVRATVSLSTNATIAGSATSLVILKTCATNSATESDWIEQGRAESDNTVGLAITVSSAIIQKQQICADVPSGFYFKLENSGTGTHAESYVSGQKTIYG